MSRAKWYEQGRDQDRRIIFIVDSNSGGTTITNDAEEVLGYYHITLGADWRVVYRDTEGEWFEIVPGVTTWMGTGIGFEPWHGEVWDILKN